MNGMNRFVSVLCISAVLSITATAIAQADEPDHGGSVNALRLADTGVIVSQMAASYGQPEFFRNLTVGFHQNGRTITLKVWGDAGFLSERTRGIITRELRLAFHHYMRKHGYRMEVIFIPRTH